MNFRTIPGILLIVAAAGVRADTSYTNYIVQTQSMGGSDRLMYVDPQGSQLSPLAMDEGGALFELFTMKSDLSEDPRLLSEQFVGVYIPQAGVEIVTGDPYEVVPRTRADQPFEVLVTVNGIQSGDGAPDAARSVTLRQHVQSYGQRGTEEDIDPGDAMLLAEGSLTENNTYRFTYPLPSVPGNDRSKLRGEERFSVHSLPDYQADAQTIANVKVQVWPVADGMIMGLEDSQELRFDAPDVTLTLNDLYPDSETFAQVYPGTVRSNANGTMIPESVRVFNETVPQDIVLVLDEWDTVIAQSGVHTMEILTRTPFGTDRLDFVTFTVNRDLRVNASVSTVE